MSLLRLGDAISSASKSTGGAADPCSAGYCETFRPEDWLAGWKTAPLPNGAYEVRLLVDDGYSSVTSSPSFKIVAS